MSTPPPHLAGGFGAVPGQSSGERTGGGAMWAPMPPVPQPAPQPVPQPVPQAEGRLGAPHGGHPGAPVIGAPVVGPGGTPGVPTGPTSIQAPPTLNTPVPPAPRRRRGLLWGIGGALAASAVWAAAVLTVPGMVTGKAPAPPAIGGYRVVDDLCATARLTTFTQLYPSQSGTPYHYTTRNRALDDMYCSQYRKKLGTDSDYYSLYLQAQLHKATDPRPEFEAQRDGLSQRLYQVSSVPNLGDDAYLGYLDDPGRSDRTWHYLTQVLYVRQGGATFYASWSGSYQEGKTPAPDREEVRLALLADARELLRTLGGTA